MVYPIETHMPRNTSETENWETLVVIIRFNYLTNLKNSTFILIVVSYKVVYHVAFVAFIKLSCACVTPLSLGSDVLLFARCVHS